LLQRQRKEVGKLLRKKTRSERYPIEVNLEEIRPESENSEEDLKERYLNEIDFRKGFREC
jgi:hypothetical protein